MSRARLVTEDQAHKLAELYVWDCVVSLLEGSTAPRDASGQKAAERVIGICKREQQKLIRMFDATPNDQAAAAQEND